MERSERTCRRHSRDQVRLWYRRAVYDRIPISRDRILHGQAPGRTCFRLDKTQCPVRTSDPIECNKQVLVGQEDGGPG